MKQSNKKKIFKKIRNLKGEDVAACPTFSHRERAVPINDIVVNNSLKMKNTNNNNNKNK